MDRSQYPTRLCRLGEKSPDRAPRTAAERIAMVWTLTLQAWAFRGGGDAESRLRRRALETFGAPLHDLTLEDLSRPEVVFQIGLVPQRIDLLTSITGVSFEEVWENRIVVEIEGMDVPVLGRSELVRNKRAVGRSRDLADIEELGERD